MCLSTIYNREGQDRVVLGKNIATVKVNGDEITLTDLMGVRTVLHGTIAKIDLMDNYIVVSETK